MILFDYCSTKEFQFILIFHNFLSILTDNNLNSEFKAFQDFINRLFHQHHYEKD